MHTNPAVNPPAAPAKPTALPLPAGALLAALLGVLPAQEALAKCVARMQDINFGNINLLTTPTIEIQTQVTVTCEKAFFQWNPQSFNICLAVDGGQTQQGHINPRRLCKDNSCISNLLTYNLYINPSYRTIWSASNQVGGSSINKIITVNSVFTPESATFPVYAKLELPQTNITPGLYYANFANRSTALAFTTTTATTPRSCRHLLSDERFPFNITANVVPSCIISEAININFGTANTTDTGLQGQSSFKVTCTKNTPYNIGLEPSNGNKQGQGQMSGVQAGNTDKIAYQLRSTVGMDGKEWGNDTSANRLGNGVAGTGTGTAQTHKVYATIANLRNYRAGEYRDRVTINVYY